MNPANTALAIFVTGLFLIVLVNWLTTKHMYGIWWALLLCAMMAFAWYVALIPKA